MNKYTLQTALSDYLAMRRALGVKLYRQGKALATFVLFAESEGVEVITTKLALRWATLPKNVDPATWTGRLSLIRQFARYCCTLEPETEIPPYELLPYRYRRKPPYIYTQEEIGKLLQAARKLTSKHGLRSLTYETLFGLLATTGMRISEALSLEDSDVDLVNGILMVRNTKFGKTRYVPIHHSTTRALDRYIQKRKCRVACRQSPGYFMTESGTRLSYNATQQMFHRIIRDAGLHFQKEKHRPCLHSFRHTFAVRTLVNWYNSGANVDARLPLLATYLGHAHVTDTHWYLSSVPELLCCAVRNLDQIVRRNNYE
jgi:integrase